MSTVYLDSWLSHRVVHRNLIIDMEYIAKTPLRIGSGKASKLTSPIDEPVITIKINGVDKPYIPGSSIKGIFRSAAEYISRSSGLKACNAGEECKENYDKKLQQYLKENEIENALNLLKEKYCLACKIFGVSTYKSHIDFGDAYPFGDIFTDIKVGISIDRKSGAVKKGALYTVEYINPGAKFKGKITLNNVPNYGVGLIFHIIDLINVGIIKFGGMKTRGFGQIKSNISKIVVYTFDNGEFKEIKEKKILKALDESDENIEFDPTNYLNYINNCKEAWNKYVSKAKS